MSRHDRIPVADRPDRRVITGDALRCVAMPMGGIGAGQIALAGDGGWRQWQIMNRPNHLGYVPNSFFAVYVRPHAVHFTQRKRPEDLMGRARVLMSDALYDDSGFEPSVTVSDHIVPDEARRLLRDLPGVETVEYIGEYPVAELTFRDPNLPFPVHMTAYSPFAPLDPDRSGLPAVVVTLRARNTTETRHTAGFAATLQNAVGWDGVGKIRGNHFSGYGGNVNRIVRQTGLTAVEMLSDRISRDDARWGSMAISSPDDNITYLGSWDSLETFWADFTSDGALNNECASHPTAEGSTVCGALARTQSIDPGEETTATFLLTWYFPNHYVNWDQQGLGVTDRKSKFWLGTHYAPKYTGAVDVARYVTENLDSLTESTFQFRNTFYDSTLPYWLLDAVTSQASIIRSPTCIWLEDGTFQAFEGCHGASTGSPEDTGGCCPLNCTHVWNYEQALARLFPSLEQTMRRIDLQHQMTEQGRIGFRTKLPLYLPRWTEPAADGQCGTVLKTYRESRATGDRAFLNEMYPSVKQAVHFIFDYWDSDRDGLLSGEQHNTYDTNLHGWSSFTSSMYLAALRACEEMAQLCDDAEFARECREVYDRGTKKLDAELWNGEYYIQKPDRDRDMKHQYGTGCHIDQILGQWWAHVCDLGYILPREHVRTALASIVKNNWRDDFAGFVQTPRVYASPQDSGTLTCTWPHGGKPEEPTLYSDEVWNGLEYQLAASLLYEGMTEEAKKIAQAARKRYDGTQRNPWNEVECGDHYARSMSSWSLLEAACGYRYDAASGRIGFAPKLAPESFRGPFFAAEGWGTFSQNIGETQAQIELSVSYGSVTVSSIALQVPGASELTRTALDETGVSADMRIDNGYVTVEMTEPVRISVGCKLAITIAC